MFDIKLFFFQREKNRKKNITVGKAIESVGKNQKTPFFVNGQFSRHLILLPRLTRTLFFLNKSIFLFFWKKMFFFGNCFAKKLKKNNHKFFMSGKLFEILKKTFSKKYFQKKHFFSKKRKLLFFKKIKFLFIGVKKIKCPLNYPFVKMGCFGFALHIQSLCRVQKDPPPLIPYTFDHHRPSPLG